MTAASDRTLAARLIAPPQPRFGGDIFRLRFIEGLSNREIAQALGISQVLVSVFVHRARQQLRKELRP